MSDTPLVLPQQRAPHVNVFASVSEFLDKIMAIEIRDHAPTIFGDGVPVHWLPSVIVSEEQHPLTQEVSLKPGLMLSIWIGPNEHGQAIGVNPIMDQVYALTDRAEIVKFLRFCLTAIEESYKGAMAQGIEF